MNVLTILKQDHRNVDELFNRFEATDEPAELGRIRDKVVEQLSVHATVEEQVFYPAIRDASDELRELVLEALEEHHAAKTTLSELEKMPPTAERFRAKMSVLIENVRHHVEEEENELFEKVREAVQAKQLEQIGETLEQAKQTAPTRPHPLQPDQPPLNVLLGAPVAVLDRVVTTARDVFDRVVLRKAS